MAWGKEEKTTKMRKGGVGRGREDEMRKEGVGGVWGVTGRNIEERGCIGARKRRQNEEGVGLLQGRRRENDEGVGVVQGREEKVMNGSGLGRGRQEEIGEGDGLVRGREGKK